MIKLTDIYLIIVILLAINALLRILELVLKKSKAFADKPVSSYFQLIKIILYIAAGILIISIINKSPVYLPACPGCHDRPGHAGLQGYHPGICSQCADFGK